MKKIMIAGLLLLAMTAATVLANQPTSEDFAVAVGDYFGISKAKILETAGQVTAEELSVVCYVAERSKMKVSDVVNLRKNSEDWAQVIAECGLTSADMFVWGIGGASSKTYSPIVERYKSRASKTWNEISLSDNEIVDLVNLRFVLGHFGTTPQDVMSARDATSDWKKVYANVKQVALSKSKPAIAKTE